MENSIEQVTDILIKALRGLAIEYHGGIRHGFWIRIEGYCFVYKPYWSSHEYVPSELATYKVYRYRHPTKRWFNILLGSVKYDDGEYMGIEIGKEMNLDIKDEQGFMDAVMCLNDNLEWNDKS